MTLERKSPSEIVVDFERSEAERMSKLIRRIREAQRNSPGSFIIAAEPPKPLTNGLRFEVTWSASSCCWAITGPKGFYLAVRSELLAEGIRAMLEGRTVEARDFFDQYIADNGMFI